MRGVPDVAFQASATTGVLIYDQGWYVIGGTSASSPQWAGLIALADQIAGRDLGYINPALYSIALNSVKYAADFYDVTTNCNQYPGSSIAGYCASQGWDAVTGLGTPNAANLIPDLIAAIP
jgi:subtilase family serine protease